MFNIYPWQQQTWHDLVAMQQQQQLPHALMFSGVVGMGKRELALRFMQYLHCVNKNENGPCGVCDSCKQFAAESHPAHYVLQPKEGAAKILVDEVRALKHWLTHVAANSEYKTILVNSMDNINLAACNALLKFLEEPPGNVCFILLDNRQAEIMPTILSRVQVVSFAHLSNEMMQQFLQQKCDDVATRLACYNWYEVGALQLLEVDVIKLQQQRDNLLQILATLRLKQIDAVAAAEIILKEDVKLYFNIWSSIVNDLIRTSYHAQQNYLAHADKNILLQEMAAGLSPVELAKFCEVLQQYKADFISPNNIDKNLLLANLLLAWQEA